MCDLSEGQCCVGLNEVYIGRNDINVPFCEVSMHQDEQIDDVRETERDTRQ